MLLHEYIFIYVTSIYFPWHLTDKMEKVLQALLLNSHTIFFWCPYMHYLGLNHLQKELNALNLYFGDKSHSLLMAFFYKLINARITCTAFLTISENELSLADIPMTGME